MSQSTSPIACAPASGEAPATFDAAGRRPADDRLRFAGQLSRWFHTLRYHRPEQLARRAVSIARQRWPVARRTTGGDADSSVRCESPELLAVANRVAKLLAETNADSAVDASSGRLRFLNGEVRLGSPIDWTRGSVSRLWRFHLHYHEWLFGLPVDETNGEFRRQEAAWSVIEEWTSRFPGPNAADAADAWHPFCISRRVPVWISLWAMSPPPADFADDLADSLHAQAAHLEHRLEKDLGGNHLLENARGLAFAGAFFSGRDGERWRTTAMKIVRSQVDEQVLPHGEHFERSPMYHSQMLCLFADLRDLYRGSDPAFSDECSDVVDRMSSFLRAIVHPDGEIPLLGDSCLGETPPAGSVPVRCEPASNETGETASLRQGGRRVGDYWTFREGDDFLLFDAGPVGPDHLPAHAHADLLNIEASVGSQRLFVDSGVHDYEAGEMRKYCRSTAAHNVLEVDGENQCDVWSRFRMGRRGWPSGLATGCEHELLWAAASHNAYRNLGVSRVARWVGCRRGGTWVIVDWTDGRGTHWLVNRLHLHPDTHAEQTAEDHFELEIAGRHISVVALGGGRAGISRGWYCPEFGRRHRTQVLESSTGQESPTAMGWLIKLHHSSAGAELDWDADAGPILSLANSRLRLRDCLNA